MKKPTFRKSKVTPEDGARAIREAEEEIDYLLRALSLVSGEHPEKILQHAANNLLRFIPEFSMLDALEWLWQNGYPRGAERWTPPARTVVGQLFAAEEALSNGRGRDAQLKALARFIRGQFEGTNE